MYSACLTKNVQSLITKLQVYYQINEFQTFSELFPVGIVSKNGQKLAPRERSSQRLLSGRNPQNQQFPIIIIIIYFVKKQQLLTVFNIMDGVHHGAPLELNTQ